MDVEYQNTLNRMLTRNGFGPQMQGVRVDWQGLDETLREHYRSIFESEQPKREIPDEARTRRPRKSKKDENETGGDDVNGDDGGDSGQ